MSAMAPPVTVQLAGGARRRQAEAVLAAGYRPAGSLPRDLTLGDQPTDVTVLEHIHG